MIAKVLFLTGVALMVCGATRWWTVEDVTTRSLRAVDEYAQTQKSLVVNTQNTHAYTWTNWDYPDNLRRLMLRVSLAGGLHRGVEDFIGFGAVGLILIVISYYRPKKRNEKDASTG